MFISCHSERRKRGIFLHVKTHGGLKMNHYHRKTSLDRHLPVKYWPKKSF